MIIWQNFILLYSPDSNQGLVRREKKQKINKRKENGDSKKKAYNILESES